ncbi:DegT/DnrJ/EryC1/StrS family aminotransferase [Alphaproteobacteria bacterium]|nr:DegT/DnrJ/EryC1/StrS family aminotransferase [Alphaproteobacteria bacterium]
MVNHPIKYPYSRPSVDNADASAVSAVLKSHFLTQGPEVKKLECELQTVFGTKYAIVLNSATASLHAVYNKICSSDKDIVLVSSITFASTATASLMVGATPMFVDVDPSTGNMCPIHLQAMLEKYGHRVRAVALTHMAGRAANVGHFSEIVKSFDCNLIEDASHAPLAEYNYCNQVYKVGECAHSKATILSFHAIKHISAGEGGAILTNCHDLANAALIFRSHGMIKDKDLCKNAKLNPESTYYEIQELGYNYRLSDIHSALARSQLRKLEKKIKKLDKLSKVYWNELHDLRFITLPELNSSGLRKSVWHLYPVLIDFDCLPFSRNELMDRLGGHGIQTQIHYIPLYKMPIFNCAELKLSCTESYYHKVISLPMHQELSEKDVVFISHTLKKLIEA